MIAPFQQYFYFIGVTLLVPVWVYLFLKKDRRSDMLFVGIIFGLFALVIDKFYATLDYWHPVYLISWLPLEDFYYGFIYGGISAELYERVFNKRSSLRRTHKDYSKMLWLLLFTAVPSFFIVVNIFHLNSIISHILPLIICAIVIAAARKDLIIPELWSGVVLTVLTFFMFQVLLLIYPEIFQNHWLIGNLSGLYFVGIPLEELIFSFAVGLSAGQMYEFLHGYSIITIHANTKS